MRVDVRSDWDFSNKYLRQIRRTLGELLIGVAPLDLDMKQATDLLMLRANPQSIACRIRKPGYEWAAWDFTIRSSRDTGSVTEEAKILDGFADLMFYGHAANDVSPDSDGALSRWLLVDLNKWRKLARLHGLPPETANKSDGTKFRAYDVRDAWRGCVVRSSHRIPAELVDPYADLHHGTL